MKNVQNLIISANTPYVKKKEKRKINYFPLTFDIQSCFNSVF